MDKKSGIAFLEIDMDKMAEAEVRPVKYDEPSRFPAMDIDLSFVGDVASFDLDGMRAELAACAAASSKADWATLKTVCVYDVYEAEGETSVTLRFTFSAKDRTLTKAGLSEVTDEIVAVFAKAGYALKA
jgi:phenylalanyl-tRNA synthetase beta chain